MGTFSGYLLHSIIDLFVDDLLHILMKFKGIWMILKMLYLMISFQPQNTCVTSQRNHNSQKNRNSIEAYFIGFQQRYTKVLEEDLTLYFDNVKDHD